MNLLDLLLIWRAWWFADLAFKQCLIIFIISVSTGHFKFNLAGALNTVKHPHNPLPPPPPPEDKCWCVFSIKWDSPTCCFLTQDLMPKCERNLARLSLSKGDFIPSSHSKHFPRHNLNISSATKLHLTPTKHCLAFFFFFAKKKKYRSREKYPIYSLSKS